jgi:pilin isopeptide linkage protein/fibro-slime domain-containing protein/fimbrial isopeptide formation D2 family protein
MLKPFGKKTNTTKRVLRVLAVPLAACALLFGATSASADQTVPFSNHIVKTVNPTGTTVNLFDYWVVNGGNDKSVNINDKNGNNNTGINKDHQLKFNGGAGTGINRWTGRSDTKGFGRLSFVKNTLVNGYPEIDGTYASYNTHGTYEDESLDYLFNSASQANENDKQDGKAVYNNVQGLFQLKKGYYVYDSYGSDGSDGNYAVYNPTTNSFNVYDKAGVYKGDASSETNLGQFFPFDSAKKVFTDNGNGLSPNSVIDGDNSTLNHHFGMSMTTEFVQPAGGKTTDNKDMVFEFSGDDDVWVYIDGVLVGDLGGIHEKATLEIDFATGEVKVGHVDGANGTKKEIEKTNIKAKFEAAGADTTNFFGDTFLGSTKHTLSFFYLERGAGASNMKLKFNLTTLPSSEVAKVDQNGEAVNDATFGLYRSGGPGYNWNTGELVARGTTKNGGQLILRKLKPNDSEPSDSVLSFDEEHNKNQCDYFVLKEEELPAGYRSSLTSSTTATPGELHLQYKPAAATGSGGVVVAPQTTVETADGEQWKGSRMWLNGGYLAAKETISLHKDTQDNKGHVISSGTTFAVVLKRTDENKSDTDENAWTAVTGNPLNGYKLCSKHGIEGAVEAAQSADTSVFGVNTNDDYEVTVGSLPGDIEKYAAMMTDKSKAEYTVAVYHTTASSLAGATIGNTSMVKYQTINRQFSTVIHLTNVQNRLFVQKVDDLGRPVNDAKFELYKAEDVIGNSPSTYAIKSGAEPYDTVQTKDATYPYEIKGMACFPLDSAHHEPLIKGTYYLRESKSPDGYEINNTITKVIVDDSGVYVDAGKEGEDDGVRSMSGPGSLIASLAQFGSPDSIDNTLTHIKGMLQSATGVDAKGNLTWGQVKSSLADVHMRYDKATQGTKTILRYVEKGGERDGKLATIYADTGINRMALYQDGKPTNGTNLGTLQLNHLFTTSTAVQYTDRRVARLQVTKTVTADSGLTAPTKDANGNDLTFTFKFALPDSKEGYEARVFDANGKPMGNSFTLKNGGTHSIKAGETIRVYDLKQGDSYSVSELTTKGEESSGNVLSSIVNTVTGSADESALPAGFSLVSRRAGGKEQSGTGNTITGEIVELANGLIPADNTLEFINKYSVISVPVEKKWVGPAAAKATVRLLADGKDTGKSIELNESNNWRGSFKGLAKYSKSGSEVAYTVAEDAVEGYSPEVTGDAGRGFTVTNTVKTGELDVSKTVVAREGLAVDADKIFKFVVEATDATGRDVSGTYGDATFKDGKATLKLKDGQTARIMGLPAGTVYTVTERAAAGYKAAVNGVEGSKADGSISADQVASAAFSNTFDPAPVTASVPELTKVLAGGRKPGLQEGEFAFELSLADGAGNVLEGYPIEAKNDKDGKVSFGELSFTNPGAYHATVTERASGDVLIEDDAHAYTFDITVAQTGAGLKAEISNERGKKTFTNTFTPHDNTKTVTKADASGAKVDVDGKPVGVGDTLTYTIGWANNSVDDNGAARAADVTVTDVLPKGVDYVEGTAAENATYDAATRTLTWSLGEQAAGATGTLSFDVKVSAEAAVVDDISNTATVKVGENESQTTTTHNNVSREGSLTVKKTVVGGDSQREFGFAVTLTDGDGESVSGTFGKGEHAVTFAGGKATFTLKDGEEKTIAGLPVGARYTVAEDAAEGYTTTVNGADGSKAEGAVTEDGATVAFTNTYGTATEGRDVSTAGLFTKTLEGRDWAEGDSFQFALTGEDGAPMPEGSADGSKTVSVTAAGTKAGDRVAFDFGPIRYTLNDIKDAGFAEVGGKRVRAKTFTYTVREVRPDDGSAIAGVDYDGHVATMTVTVTDDGSGNLTATTPAIAQASGGDFVNTYTTELDYSARAGVRLSKTLSGRAMEAGQFAFTVTADAETAAKLGLKTDKDAYAVAAADDGEADLIDLVGGAAGSDVKFTDADAGKTYSFTVTETKLGGEGYTNDTAPRTVTIAPAYDAATGKLTVTTTVAKDGVEVARSEVSTADDAMATPAPVTVAFENSYEATGALGGEGGAVINATKTLTGRAAAAGEFSFSVRDARGDVVATATNRASGDGEAAGLAFSPISYTTDALERMVADGTAARAADGSWVISYTVSEDGTDRLPAGVTATASSFDITVKVADDGKGGLDVSVVYPEGSGGTLSFVNAYGAGEATVDLAGTKTLALSQAGLGLAQADIAGKYTFKIEPLDGAPAPVNASDKTVTEATNDAAGNVELGSVTFRQPSDLDDVEIDGDGLRTKTFAYRVSESGSVDGVVNDATAIRTFTVKVVEDTNAGTLAAEVLPAEGTPEGKGAFEFTNTYVVNPTPSSVTDQIKVSKKLKGRDLAEGEFEFQLVEIAADGSKSVAATGKNAADGTVVLSPVTYTAPGTHSYELREVAGTAGGVTYDRATYRVRTTVVDAGNGTLAVKHELMDAEGNAANDTSVTFTNGYEAAPVTLKLGAAKVFKGAELKAGQFSFELKSRDGKVMSTARNAADGSVTFDALTFKQAGTYTFTVSEVDDGQAHVTYDKAVRKIVVTVGDEAADGTKMGYLSAKVSYEGDANMPPVFTNSYAENPGTPGTPENPGTPGGGSGGGSDSGSGGDGSKGDMPDTGDRSLPVEALGAMAGIGALAVAGGAVLYRRRR